MVDPCDLGHGLHGYVDFSDGGAFQEFIPGCEVLPDGILDILKRLLLSGSL